MNQFRMCSDKATWDRYLADYPEANFLQSWQWAETYARRGNTILRHTLTDDGVVKAVVAGVIHTARRGKYLEIAGGPLVDWSDTRLVTLLMNHIATFAREQRCVFVRIRPQAQTVSLTQFGLRPARMHLHAEHTSILDISRDTEVLLAAMRQQTRYEIRRAPKRGISISSNRASVEIDEFIEMQYQTAHRQGFTPSSPDFLREVCRQFGDDARLYRAQKNGQTLNLALILHFGQETDYYEAASIPAARNEPGAYAILWQVINDAKQRQMSRVNLWGIAPSNSGPAHRYARVTTFKRGFGGDDTTYTHAHDLVLRPIAYTKNWLVESIRKKRRNV